MKRKKIVGLILLIGTLVYLFASFLALYQNQRVKMEKGIEEALKAYSDKESMEVKELSKDFNLLLDEKLDANDLNERMHEVENYYNSLYEEVVNMNTFYEKSLLEIENAIVSVQSELEEIKTNISKIEGMILNNDTKQEENIRMLQEQIALCEQRLVDLEGNALYFQYDAESQTLNVFGRKEEQQGNE